MNKYGDIAKELGIDPEQGVEKILADAGELIIDGRLVKAEPARASTKSATEREGE